MQNGFDSYSFGSNMLFANNIAIKEYFDSLPLHVQYAVTAHIPELNSIEEMRNYADEFMRQS